MINMVVVLSGIAAVKSNTARMEIKIDFFMIMMLFDVYNDFLEVAVGT